MDIKVEIVHYGCYANPSNPDPTKLAWYQSIIYGQVIDGRKRSHLSMSDFQLVSERGKSNRGIYVAVGKPLLDALQIKTRIIAESRKRIAAYKKKLRSGKPVTDRDEFTVRIR